MSKKLEAIKRINNGESLKKIFLEFGVGETTDEASFLWFKQQRAQGIPISGNILQEKAFLLSQKLNENGSFSARQDWLDKLRKRYGFRQQLIAAKILSDNKDCFKDFVESFKCVINML